MKTPRPLSRLTRDSAIRTLDEKIGDMVRAAEQSGELRACASWGKPLDLGDGYSETPPELRMAYKILKDAACAPAEVQLINELASLRRQLLSLDDRFGEEAQRLRLKIVEMEATLGLRMERIARERS